MHDGGDSSPSPRRTGSLVTGTTLCLFVSFFSLEGDDATTNKVEDVLHTTGLRLPAEANS
jgi:hypothetical protein